MNASGIIVKYEELRKFDRETLVLLLDPKTDRWMVYLG